MSERFVVEFIGWSGHFSGVWGIGEPDRFLHAFVVRILITNRRYSNIFLKHCNYLTIL